MQRPWVAARVADKGYDDPRPAGTPAGTPQGCRPPVSAGPGGPGANHQITLSCSRKATIFSWASPSSSMISPALRSSAAATLVISWPAPPAPTAPASTPRSATFSASTGLFLAAMIPLNDGYRGSTTPAVTVTRAGSGQVTSS